MNLPRCTKLIVVATLLRCGAACYADGPQTTMLAMSDGVKLATDVYLPEGRKPPFATILIRTPYGKSAGQGIAKNLGFLGYALVAQDVRGRFASEGHPAIIFGNEGIGGVHRDAHETLEWIAKQEWSNGKVATWGGSALGITQNMGAPNAPNALKGQVVSVAFSNYYHQAAYQGGVWRKELLEGWLTGQKLTDVNLPTFLDHPNYDEFWKKLNAEAYAEQVNAPGVFIGGWYDIFLQGTINSFVTIQERGGPQARGKCFLVIAPIAHGNFNQKVSYPSATAAPVNIVAPMNLYDYWLNDAQNGVEKLKPVHYYVMGDTEEKGAPGNFWRAADSWPPPATKKPFFFCSDKTIADVPTAENGELRYQYDPQSPVPTVGGQNLLITKGPMDQREVESRADVLVFTTKPLAEPMEITGPISAKLFVSSDCPDTDFTVKLCDVFPDGKSMLIADGIQRASLRNSFEKRELLEAGTVYELNVDLWSTSIVINKGHSIRVAVSSSNSPRFEPNPNTGDPHPTMGKTRIANNTLFVSEKYPSQITLPVFAGDVVK